MILFSVERARARAPREPSTFTMCPFTMCPFTLRARAGEQIRHGRVMVGVSAHILSCGSVACHVQVGYGGLRFGDASRGRRSECVRVTLRRFVRGPWRSSGEFETAERTEAKTIRSPRCVTGPGSRGRVRYITQNNAARNRWHLLSTSVTHRGFVDQGTALRRTVDKNYEYSF